MLAAPEFQTLFQSSLNDILSTRGSGQTLDRNAGRQLVGVSVHIRQVEVGDLRNEANFRYLRLRPIAVIRKRSASRRAPAPSPPHTMNHRERFSEMSVVRVLLSVSAQKRQPRVRLGAFTDTSHDMFGCKQRVHPQRLPCDTPANSSS